MYFTEGDRVRVKVTGMEDKAFHGALGTFVQITNNGYARVRMDNPEGCSTRDKTALIHPESLESE